MSTARPCTSATRTGHGSSSSATRSGSCTASRCTDMFVDARFQDVQDAFEANLPAPDETGAAVHVVVDGRPVVDLWGGWADAARTRPWTEDTLVNAYSVGKPFIALAVLRLVADGR